MTRFGAIRVLRICCGGFDWIGKNWSIRHDPTQLGFSQRFAKAFSVKVLTGRHLAVWLSLKERATLPKALQEISISVVDFRAKYSSRTG
jgi:hypothetical protein